MIDAIKRETSSFILKLKVRGEEDTNNLTHEEVSNVKYEHTDDKIIIGDDYQQEVIPEKLEQPQRPLSIRERRERERRNI
jgi:protein translocase subunit secA